MDLERSLFGLVAAQHLLPESIAGYAASCAAHPTRLLVIEEFLVPDVADGLSTFISNEAVFQPRRGTFPGEASGDFDYGDGHLGAGALSRPAAMFVALFAAFADGRMCRLFEQLFGTPLGRVKSYSARRMTPGSFIGAHTDRAGGRRLAWNIHLTRAWPAEGGGRLGVVDRDGNVSKVPPLYNALVLFDVQADRNHFVEPVVGDWVRQTIGGWVLEPGATGIPPRYR